MCNFLSVLVMRDGSVRHHPMLDSHSDLIAYFNIPDETNYIHRFAKAELTPVDWMDASTWQWRIDEESRPDWLDDVEGAAEKKARSLASRMILKDVAPRLIVDGVWIVGGKCVLRDVRGGRIIRVQDSARISDVGGSAQISGVGGSVRISNVRGSARISGVGGSAQISGVGGSARISGVWGSAQISGVGGSAQISDVGTTKYDAVVLDDSAKAHQV